jgi:hypothetical protein
MVSKLGEKLFPKDTRFEQRRKTALLFLTLFGVIVLVAGVALVMIRISQVNFQSR